MQGFLILYILFVASVSLLSYKKGIYLVWLTFLFVPTIILEQPIKLRLSMETILMLGSVISEMRFNERRKYWNSFFTDNQKAIIAYLFLSFTIALLSQTVPLKVQFLRVLDEIAILLFVLQTFILVKNEEPPAFTLRRMVCWAIVYNIVYCVFFEIMVGINPAGMPLYILLGVDDNQFITDMIDSERGGMSFRAQTVYRHPLSLGQYMLVLLPLFLMKGKLIFKFVYAFLMCCLIVLSGSRGAMAPMILVLLLSFKSNVRVHLRKFALFLILLAIAISFVPDKQWKQFNRDIEPFIASLQFWDDQKQYENKIDGSSMEMRFNQFDAALKEISDNPIFGRGYGYRDYYIYMHNDLHPDLLGFESVLLLYLVERGWIGLLFFFVIVYYIYKLFKNEMADKSTIRYVFLGYILSIIMTGVRPLTLLFVGLACAISCGISAKQEENTAKMLETQSVGAE